MKRLLSALLLSLAAIAGAEELNTWQLYPWSGGPVSVGGDITRFDASCPAELSCTGVPIESGDVSLSIAWGSFGARTVLRRGAGTAGAPSPGLLDHENYFTAAGGAVGDVPTIQADGFTIAFAAGGGGGGAPVGAQYVTCAADGTLTAEVVPAAGGCTFLSTPSSANLLAALTTKTGTGLAVFGTSPTISDAILNSSASIGATGVQLYDDGDGMLTFLGRGNGSDEDLGFNFDDVPNTIGVTSTTGVTAIDFGPIALQSTAIPPGGSKPICALVGNSTTVDNTTTATDFDKPCTIGANSLAAGDVLEVYASGTYAEASAMAMTLGVRFGAAGVSIMLAAVSPDAAGDWHVTASATVRTIGASGTIAKGGGQTSIPQGATRSSNTSPSTFTLDTTAAQTIRVNIEMSVAAVGNSGTMETFIVKQHRPVTVIN